VDRRDDEPDTEVGDPGASATIIELTASERRAHRRAHTGPTASTLDPGVRVGRYVVERAIGAGGMGVVTLARDPELKRPVVIKLVKPDAFGDGDESRDELEARLRREAQAMAQLSHPNVVQIFDIGHHGERVFLAMEYVAGETLDGWLGARRRTAAEILAMFCQAAAGLAAAHRAGLVHRDFKPTNVLVDPDGVAKVTDFGLARAFSAGRARETRQRLPDPRVTGVHAVLTHADHVVGTPAYMPPEQAAGGEVSARGDQYTFALVLVDSLVGQSPTARSVTPVAPDSIEDGLGRVGVGARERRAIARALALDPAARWPSMTELVAELATTAPRRPRRWPMIAGLGLCAAAVITWLVVRGDRGSTGGGAPIAGADTCAGAATAATLWTAEAREQLVATFAAGPQPLDGWTGDAVASVMDRSVERLGAEQLAACKARPQTPDPCITRRLQALSAALAGVATRRQDPWPLVAAIDDCKVTPAAPVDRAIVVDHAQPHEAAEAALRGQLARLGANDPALRGRALLALLALAARTGNYAAAARDADALEALAASHTATTRRDELVIASAEGRAFLAVGDVARAAGAWQRAIAAASKLDADDQLEAATGAALVEEQRFDRKVARDRLAAALAAAPTAGAEARARVRMALADLALADGDRTEASRQLGEAAELDAHLALGHEYNIRLAQTNAPDAAASKLDAIHGNATGAIAARALLAKARVLRAANQSAELVDTLARLPGLARSLLAAERTELAVLRCEVEAEQGSVAACERALMETLHPAAPARVQIALAVLKKARVDGDTAAATQAERTAREILEKLAIPVERIPALRS
jgi:eukaryotic-like serine/threonine-protein kinase